MRSIALTLLLFGGSLGLLLGSGSPASAQPPYGTTSVTWSYPAPTPTDYYAPPLRYYYYTPGPYAPAPVYPGYRYYDPYAGTYYNYGWNTSYYYYPQPYVRPYVRYYYRW